MPTVQIEVRQQYSQADEEQLLDSVFHCVKMPFNCLTMTVISGWWYMKPIVFNIWFIWPSLNILSRSVLTASLVEVWRPSANCINRV